MKKNEGKKQTKNTEEKNERELANETSKNVEHMKVKRR